MKIRQKNIYDAVIQVEVPIIRRGPITQSRAIVIRKRFSKAVREILDKDGSIKDSRPTWSN